MPLTSRFGRAQARSRVAQPGSPQRASTAYLESGDAVHAEVATFLQGA
jgi:hypothetical protein